MDKKYDTGSGLSDANPFTGLRSFEEGDENYFRGRSKEIDDLYRRVRNNKTTIFFGRSGLGKTSLLLAGLFPKLWKSDCFPIHVRLGFGRSEADFSRQVIAQTAATGREHGIHVPPCGAEESLWEYFHRVEFWRGFTLLTPVIVFDQFEEIFTLVGTNDPRRTRFIVELSDLMENRIPRVAEKRLNDMDRQPFSFDDQPYGVVLALREDFLPDLEALRTLIPSTKRNRMRILPMNGQSAFEVVTQVDGLATEEIATQIVKLVANDRENLQLDQLSIEPALLSIFCRKLNKTRQERNLKMFTQELLDERGKKILDDFYDDTLEGYQNEAAVRVLIEDHLLTGSGRRIPIAFEDALRPEEGISREVINQLIGDRLIRRFERDGVELLELTHDLLTKAIRESRDRRRHRELEKKIEDDNVKLKRVRQRAILSYAALFFVIVVGAYVTHTLDRQKSEAVDLKRDAVKAEKKSESITELYSIAERDGRKLARVVDELASTMKPLLSSNELDADIKEKLRNELDSVVDVRKKYAKATLKAAEEASRSANQTVRDEAQLGLVELSSKFGSEEQKQVAEGILTEIEDSTREALKLLSSESKEQRKSAYDTLKKYADNPETVEQILSACKENAFGDDKRGINARYMALIVLTEGGLHKWNDPALRNDGRATLKSILDPANYCPAGGDKCIPALGPKSKKAAQRALTMNVLAEVDAEKKYAPMNELKEIAKEEPEIVVEEISNSLIKEQVGFYSRDVFLAYLIDDKNKFDQSAWMSDGDPGLRQEMTEFLDQNAGEMGPQAKEKAEQLHAILLSYR